MSFSKLGLSASLQNAVSAQGYTTPSPIQEQAIPAVLTGKDVLAAAQTGTGKTAGFALPLLQRLSEGRKPASNCVRALILTPTRELAAQVEQSVSEYSRDLPLSSAVVFGGVGINPQMKRLRRGVDVLVATPGRLLDLYQQNAVKFHQLEILVLDEADRMLDMGFIHDIKRILKLLPEQRQTLLFSATFSPTVTALAETITKQPVKISTAPENSTVDSVTQTLVPLDKNRKIPALISLIKQNNWKQALVFSRTKHGANRVSKKLDAAGIPSAAIHGNKSQGARTKALSAFKSGDIDVMVATDIAARGIDISQLPIVVNLDLPNTAADYVHRIGRTGRAGAEGEAWSLVSADELSQLKDIETLIQKLLPRQHLAGFEPALSLAPTSLSAPKKPKKPKKPKANRTNDAGQKASPSRRSRPRRNNKPDAGRNSGQAYTQ
ncbi:DEAD/DEAH box helicase [Alteromonas halophila]|uniref:DEAD-box ATP-dependent RNA helicase RhpA n=1 Tax=Alteromonas halophila TaxID=516698 RepID=A0A918JRY6_9ALTE|nr:DEAD/DEAH box helicase [Alteromonas halophila]GGW93414.1 ATP-dependent RNA helicase RhlE [Alteromonas halophila]